MLVIVLDLKHIFLINTNHYFLDILIFLDLAGHTKTFNILRKTYLLIWLVKELSFKKMSYKSQKKNLTLLNGQKQVCINNT